MSLSIEHGGGRLRIRQSIHALWTFGFGGLGFLVFVVFGATHSVECVRQPDGTVRAAVRSHRLGLASAPRVIHGIRDAELEEVIGRSDPFQPGAHPELGDEARGVQVGSVRIRSRRHSRTSSTYRVVLVDGQGGRHPVSRYYTSSRKVHEALAGQIRAFLADPALPRTVAKQPLDEVLVGMLFVLLPFLGALQYLCRTEFVFDHGTGTFTRIGTRAFPGPSTVRLPVDAIRQFSVQRVSRFRRNGGRSKGVPVVEGRDGSILRLSPFWTGTEDNALRVTQALERARLQFRQHASGLTGERGDPPVVAVGAAGSGRGAAGKICVLCGEDCGDAPRYRDDAGNYMHQACRDRR